ncbi:hypothetical protein, partial [Komagataeibacter rhaeticus]|uniref:hypothetical protein n=1 Tax=Komagataeibacter rhaeticus TaxID=215221 RepID=UPI001969B046
MSGTNLENVLDGTCHPTVSPELFLNYSLPITLVSAFCRIYRGEPRHPSSWQRMSDYSDIAAGRTIDLFARQGSP